MDETEKDGLLLGTFEANSFKLEEGQENCSKSKAESCVLKEMLDELNVGKSRLYSWSVELKEE